MKKKVKKQSLIEVNDYKECDIFCELERKTKPLVSKVKPDKMTRICQEYFDYEFTGESKVYPFKLPKKLKDIDYGILIITGASGSGKSTLLKEFDFYDKPLKEYDNKKALISNFKNADDAMDKLNSIGLSSVPVWCKPRNVLSTGEAFRADLALNMDSNTIFDEFTSTIDRTVAISCAISIGKYARKHNLKHLVLCSCHNDYINYVDPDFVIDLNEEKCYDCRKYKLNPIKERGKAQCIYLDESLNKIGEIYL